MTNMAASYETTFYMWLLTLFRVENEPYIISTITYILHSYFFVCTNTFVDKGNGGMKVMGSGASMR